MNQILGRLGCLVVIVAVGACAKKKLPQDTETAGPAPSAASPAPSGVPSGYATAHVAGVTHLPRGGDAVLLVEKGTKRAVPIFIGGTEALSIDLRLQKKRYKRPLTHDLLDQSVSKLGGRIESVRVDKLEDGIFYGTVVVVNGQSRFELDARPSDAIALALGNEAPIQISRSVLDHAGIDLERAPEELERDEQRPSGRPDPISL